MESQTTIEQFAELSLTDVPHDAMQAAIAVPFIVCDLSQEVWQIDESCHGGWRSREA